MRGPPLGVYILNAVCLFSFRPSQSENMAYLSPSNPPPVPVIDSDLPYERYSEAVRQLCLLLLPACPLFEPGEVTVVGDTPIAAGGFADIWRGTRGANSIIQKSYRCYETGDVESISRVRNELSSRTAWLTFCLRDSSARHGCLRNSLTPTLFDSSESTLLETTLLLSSLTWAAIADSGNTSTNTLKPTS